MPKLSNKLISLSDLSDLPSIEINKKINVNELVLPDTFEGGEPHADPESLMTERLSGHVTDRALNQDKIPLGALRDASLA